MSFLSDRAPAPRSRYLTPAEKEVEVRDWLTVRAEFIAGRNWDGKPIPAGDLGGYGYPDVPMFRWTDKLNALDGVCTVQSCSGHWTHDGGPAQHHDGQVWLRLSGSLTRAFERHAMQLAAEPCIRNLRTIYLPDGHQVVDIVFVSDGGIVMDSSLMVILDFFEGLIAGDWDREHSRPSSVGSPERVR